MSNPYDGNNQPVVAPYPWEAPVDQPPVEDVDAPPQNLRKKRLDESKEKQMEYFENLKTRRKSEER